MDTTQLQQKLVSIERDLNSFIEKHDSKRRDSDLRLLAVEQKLTSPGGGPGLQEDGGGVYVKAPTDPATGLPILGREHKMAHNMPDGVQGQPRLDFGKFMKGAVTGRWENAPEERKALNESNSGGILVPDLLGAEWIDIARAKAQCIAAGARTIPLLSATAKIPQLTTDVIGAWQAGELATIATAAPVIGSQTATPHTFAAYIPAISVQLFEDASPLLGTIIESAFARSFAQAMDQAALTGTGGSNQPLGLLNNGAVLQTPASGGPITADEILAAVAAVQGRNYQPNAYILSPEAQKEISKAKASTAGSYLGLPAGVDELDKFLTTAVNNNVFVGQWDKLVFFPRSPITLEISRVGDGTAWTTLAVSIRAYLRMDVFALEPGAFQVLTNFGS